MESQRKHVIETLNRCGQWCVECRIFNRAFLAALLAGLFGGVLYAFVIAPPSSFVAPQVHTIKSGMPLTGIANLLKREGMIRSTVVFNITVLVLGGERSAVAGSYFFAHPQNVFTVAARVATGDYELSPVKVTLPEGATIREMAQILEQKLGSFERAAFLSLAEGKEGYLFPDTYYFLPGEAPETVMQALEENFFRQVGALQDEIVSFGKPLPDVIIMASLLEEEARTVESRRIISGILWKRLERGMRLQVDAVFPFIIGKNTFEVTRADLAVDSPYNTYIREGLPIGPISNPGIESIMAAVSPAKSPYLYYLSDKNGQFHWSRTYEEHLRKKNIYLGS